MHSMLRMVPLNLSGHYNAHLLLKMHIFLFLTTMAKFALAIHQCKTNSLQQGNIIKVHRTPREDLVKLSQPHNSSSLIAIFS